MTEMKHTSHTQQQNNIIGFSKNTNKNGKVVVVSQKDRERSFWFVFNCLKTRVGQQFKF